MKYLLLLMLGACASTCNPKNKCSCKDEAPVDYKPTRGEIRGL